MPKKVLILTNSLQDWGSRQMLKTGIVDVDQVYRPVTKLERRFRTLHYHTNLDKSRWYNKWKNHVSEYETIILFDAFLGSDVAEYILNSSPQVRLIVFYQNPWFNNYYLSDSIRKKCEIWSFDVEDCRKYGLYYNHGFFFLNEVIATPLKNEYASDLFFVGKDKQRLPKLMKLDDELRLQGFHPYFHVLGETRNVYGKRIVYTSQEKSFLKSQQLPYETVLQYDKAAKCLLEIMQPGQTGMTMRTLEAIFFNKKFITDNLSVQKFGFYTPELIYIIGKDTRSLPEFIRNDARIRWNKELLEFYSFEHWLKMFNEEPKLPY